MEPTPKPWKEQVKDLFSMHSGERRGSIILICSLLVVGFWVTYLQWFHVQDPVDLKPMRAELERWLAQRDSGQAQDVAVGDPFAFDPNAIGREQWRALGLSDKQVDGIERYRSKGGRFRTKADLGRMYSIRPEQFQRLKPFILLPDSIERRKFAERPARAQYAKDTAFRVWTERRAYNDERAAFRKVEVNSADTTALIALPGIGPSFARGIVKYRESLGGYLSLDQLAEVYVLKAKPDALSRLKELLAVDTLMIRRIPINTCTVEEIAAHPYARWRIAKPLIAYRTQHGPFEQVEDIKGCALIDAEVFRKLAPYLSVE